MIKLKRAPEPPESEDGERILVERLWPRGVSKEKVHLAEWLKDFAPSTTLRTWYGHVVPRWPGFRRRYEDELRAPEKQVMLCPLADWARNGVASLIYTARDTEHNGAVVLKDFLERELIG